MIYFSAVTNRWIATNLASSAKTMNKATSAPLQSEIKRWPTFDFVLLLSVGPNDNSQ